MVVKNNNGLLEESVHQASLQTNHIANKREQEILTIGLTDEDSALMNHSDPCKTPKSQKIKSSGEVKRWASVVKASKNYQKPTEFSETDDQINSQVITSEMVDSVFKLLPKNFEAQKGFIISRNTLYICVPCNFELNSIIAIANHLKTRKHEDSIIAYLKVKTPPPLDYIMEYVSFFGFNLCCNLCRCTIAMSSYNPYETIVNIIAHNASKLHMAQKAISNTYNNELTQINNLVTNMYTAESSITIDNIITGSTQHEEFEFAFSNQSSSDKKSLKSTLVLNKPLIVCPENQSTSKDKQCRLTYLLSSIPSGLMDIDCIVENEKGSITCLICNRVVPPSSQNLYTHLRGSNHKKNKYKSNKSGMQENMKKNEINSTENKHTSNDVYESDIVKKIPVYLRSLKTHRVQIMASNEVDSNFEKIMIDNTLISENNNFLVRNIDGKNSYCKLCRTLMPLSTDLSSLEKNLTEHFQNVKHIIQLSEAALLSSKQKALNVGSRRVSRTLFELSENDIETENYLEETVMNDNNTKENQDRSYKLDCSAQMSAVSPQEHKKGDDALTKTATLKTLESKKVRYLKVETEQDEQVLSRRQKQISYGKNTMGYSRYCQLVSKGQRKPRDPVTPPRYAKCSRRTWDGMVRAWRRQLHAWDPPQPPTPDVFPWLTVLPSD